MSEYYVIGLRIDEERPTYCFFSSALKVGDKAVAEIDGSEFMGAVANCRQSLEKENLEAYWPISRIATERDIQQDKSIKEKDLSLVKPAQEEADKLNLKMNIFRVITSLDMAKVKIMYTADERVDFRIFLRVLAPLLKARIEMRQVGPRDKAKMVGGLGICGLKLCCSTFLNAFEGITIAMAKNQMLAINIPKLSGQCGKLICCLKYEDAAYEDAKKDFPRLGTSIAYQGSPMKVTGINVLNKTVTLNGADNSYQTLSLDDYNRILHPVAAPVVTAYKPSYTEKAPVNGIPSSTNNSASNYQRPNNPQRNQGQHYDNNRNRNNHNNNNNPSNGSYDNNRNNHNNNNHNRNDGYNNRNRNDNRNNNRNGNQARFNNRNNNNYNNRPASAPAVNTKPSTNSSSNYQGEVRPNSNNDGTNAK